MYKFIPFLILFLGESLAIYAEVVAAKNLTTITFWKMSLVMTVAGLLLVGGYVLGIKYWNIWTIGVVSIVSIIVMEPVIAYTVFQELPSKGAVIGFILGSMGLLSLIYIK